MEQDLTDQIDKAIHQTEELIQFQKEEAKYHPLAGSEWTRFQAEQEQLVRLRLIHYHTDNLIHTSFSTMELPAEKRLAIRNAAEELAASLKDPNLYYKKEHTEWLHQLTGLFWDHNEEITIKKKQHPTSFRPELILLYELVSIYHLVERYYKLEPQ